jgi:glycosyltransferase involved in cell wall biosynthesis
MNIWIFNHYAITPDMPGGTRHFDFASELRARGHDVTIYASSFHYQQFKELKLKNNEKYRVEYFDGVRFVWVKTFPYSSNNWRRFINMVSYMTLLTRIAELERNRELCKPDIVIGSSVHLFAALAAYSVAGRYRVPFVLEIRDIWPQTLVDLGKMSRFHPAVLLFGVMESFLCRRAERILTLLPESRSHFKKMGVTAEKIVYIPNGVFLKRFDAAQREFNPGRLRIFYLGGHSPSDNLNTVIDSAETIKGKRLPVELVLIGDGIEKQNLMEAVRSRGLEEIVTFSPAVKKANISHLLREADAFYLSMHNASLYKYGISFNKVFDYLASGKPVIMYGMPAGNPLETTGAGFSVDTTEGVVNAISILLGMSREEREAMGKKGREYIRTNHDIPVLVDRMERTLKEVIDAKAS